MDVDEEEVGEEQGGERGVEAEGCGIEGGNQAGEQDRRDGYGGEEGASVAMVEAVAFFEVVRGGAGVEEAVGCVEHPDGDRHREDGGEREMNVVGRGDEPGPEGGDGWGVE